MRLPAHAAFASLAIALTVPGAHAAIDNARADAWGLVLDTDPRHDQGPASGANPGSSNLASANADALTQGT